MVNTPWEAAASAKGATESERTLTKLARRASLSLWSYSNLYTDEGRRNGKGDGKELCDVLVVFGRDVLLFSDKHCEYQSHADPEVAWRRWYRRAIEKSARQLIGAENVLKRNPKRVFLDRECQSPLPVQMPDPTEARYFLFAVTRGAHDAAARYFGKGSSGSLILNSAIEGNGHHSVPFQVGFPVPGRRFIHLLDEFTSEVLLEELGKV